jgi:hypothetical protein
LPTAVALDVVTAGAPVSAPLPAAMAMLTFTPDIGWPLASFTVKLGEVASGCPAVPVCASPATMVIETGVGGGVVGPSLHAAKPASASNPIAPRKEVYRINGFRK